jgi:hypothetical protein
MVYSGPGGLEMKRVIFKLWMPVSNIRPLAKRYSYSQRGTEVEFKRLTAQVRENGRLTKDQLLTICQWKASRSAGNAERNAPGFVECVTQFAFAASDERARIESLTLLDGVGWPTASVILHLFHKDRYPILDYRALWSVGVEVPHPPSFDFWWQYTLFCRKLARKAGVRIRTLDKALWQFSKENQPAQRTVHGKGSHRK